jgi:hypothetical protein
MFKIVLSIFLIVSVNALFCQEIKLVKPQVINSNEVVTPQTERITVLENAVTKTYLVKNEEYYTLFIKALEGKKKYLQNDSALNTKAETIGWYNKVNAEIEKAEIELLKLKDNDK